MNKCPFCKGTEWTQSKTDLGIGHFKAEKIRPIRIQFHRCNGCGYVAMFAPKEDK